MTIINWVKLLGFNSGRAEFYMDFAEMFETGQNVREFLQRQAKISSDTGQSSFQFAYTEMLRRFDSGDSEPTLPYLLEGLVDDSDMVTLSAIEEGGPTRKHIGLRELADSVLRKKAIVSLLLKSIAMPAVMLPFVGFMSYILADVILTVERTAPDFAREEIFTGFNEVVRVVAVFTKNYGPLVAIGIVGFIALFVVILNRWVGPLRLKFDSMLGFALYRDFQAAAFFSNLAPLLESGKKLLPALELLASKSNRWTRWQVRRILGSLEESPTEYEQAFSLGICSPFVEGRLSTLVGILKNKEARGDYKMEFADVIVTIGKKEVDKTMQRISTSAAALNTTLITVLFCYASLLGLGSMTVPGKFSELIEPSQIQILKDRYATKVKARKEAAKLKGLPG